MFAMILLLGVLGLFMLGYMLSFLRTTKTLPKSWWELKMELSYQYFGVMGLVDDFKHRSDNHVEISKQSGRVAVLTGGNRGIGLWIAEKLLKCGITVVMGVRNPMLAEKAVRKLVPLNDSNSQLLVCESLDVGDLTSVRTFANKIKAKYSKIDILINNAGIMFAPFKLTADGFESHFAINYLGHFLLQHLLLPELKAAGTTDHKARIVNVSSCMHLIGRINYKDINAKKYYYPAFAYSQSKLAQVLSTNHLQKLLNANKEMVQVFSVHPGVVDTDLFEHTLMPSLPWLTRMLFKTPEEGSRTPVFAAISATLADEKGALYLSNCRKGRINPNALDADKCEKFFEFSCNLLDIKKFGAET